MSQLLQIEIKPLYLHSQFSDGTIAQLVEQRTENPCVPGSIPGGTTGNERVTKVTLFSFCLKYRHFKIKVKPRVKPKINISEGINILCYKSKTLANGEHPLMVRVCKDGKVYNDHMIELKTENKDFTPTSLIEKILSCNTFSGIIFLYCVF